MENTYLTVKEVAELKGCTERYIQTLIEKNSIIAETLELNTVGPGRGGIQYRIPLTALDAKLQLKYKRKQKKKESIAPEPVSITYEQLNIEALSESERQEIGTWKKLLDDWRKFRSNEKNKAEADEKFISLINLQQPELKLTRRTLYRKWNGYNNNGEAALLDKRGKHEGHSKRLSGEIWDIFEYYYLDESQKSTALCMTLTQLSLEQKGAYDLLPLPSSSTFNRQVKKIPIPYVEYFRHGKKAFLDKCSPYIKRIYSDLESNDIWVADNHTFDIMVTRGEGPMRIHLTSFLDVRSRKMMGWYVTDNPCSDATIYALKRGIEKYGIPKMIYTDNGREFLFHDFGGNGFRKKSKKEAEFKPPTILEKLQIEFRTALPKNGKAKIVERSYRTVKETFSKLFEAYTGGHIKERPERLKEVIKQPDKLTQVQDFMQYVDTYLSGWYNKQPHTGEGMNGKTPDEVFAENLIEKRVATKEDLNLMLMRTSRPMKVRRNGVSLKFYGQELEYWTNELLLNHIGESVYVRYEPLDLSKVRVYSSEDIFICEAPLANQLSYQAAKDEIGKAQKDIRSFEKTVKAYKKQKNIETEDALKLILDKAVQNEAEGEHINPKVLRIVRADEKYAKAAGAENEFEEPINWTEALRKRKEDKRMETLDIY